MSKNTWQWLVILGAPYLLIGAASGGHGFLLLPLGGTMGVLNGLMFSNIYASQGFRITFLLGCLLLVLLFLAGWRYRAHWLGKILCALAVYLWCLAGLIGFGPQ